jgi:hypothetical protein
MLVSHLYKITNKITGEYYVGKHNGWTQKTNKNQLYWGSGIRIMNLVKKYGKENFTYEIFCHGTPEYVFELEQKYVSVELVEHDKLCLNLTIGAQAAGGGNYSSSGGYSIHTFTGNGTFAANNNFGTALIN